MSGMNNAVLVRASWYHTAALRDSVSMVQHQRSRQHFATCTPGCRGAGRGYDEVAFESLKMLPSPDTSCRWVSLAWFDTVSIELVVWFAWRPRSRQQCCVSGSYLKSTLLEVA
jgi:hypothetical protein